MNNFRAIVYTPCITVPAFQLANLPQCRGSHRCWRFFDITIQGKGGHGAFPHLAIDPIPIAGELIGSLQTLVSRSTSPNESAVFSITKVHSGDAYNVIPDSAVLSGTVRTFSMDKMNDIEAQVESLAKGSLRRTEGRPKSLFACFFTQ